MREGGGEGGWEDMVGTVFAGGCVQAAERSYHAFVAPAQLGDVGIADVDHLE